jgi:2-oxoisovalerate dehydrogenase E1 component alpha subunit
VAFFESVDAEGDELAVRIRKGTLEMADPAGTEIFDHVYAEQTPPLAAQRAEFVAYHETFEGEGR